MKVPREQLKSIVRELVIEVLSEGLGNLAVPRATSKQVAERSAVRKPQFDPRLDTPPLRRAPTDALREAVKRESGGNPIMADILADTAVTTLPTMLSHGDAGAAPTSPAPGIPQREQFQGNPEEVFGDAAVLRPDGSSHWADLAFMPAAKKTT